MKHDHKPAENAQSELLSAFMDDSLGHKQAQDAGEHILKTPALQAQWNEWHLIGDVIRSRGLAHMRPIADRVRDRLADEPVHLPFGATAKVSTDHHRRDRFRAVYAGAVAAAIAFVALIAVAPQMQSPNPSVLATGPVARPVSPAQLADPRLHELLDTHGAMAVRPVSDVK